MARDGRVLDAIFDAIDAVNALAPEDRRIPKSEAVELLGDAAGVDSLGLINLIVTVEQQVETRFGRTISLTGDDELTRSDGPLRTVGALADYVGALLDR